MARRMRIRYRTRKPLPRAMSLFVICLTRGKGNAVSRLRYSSVQTALVTIYKLKNRFTAQLSKTKSKLEEARADWPRRHSGRDLVNSPG
jgi:hypothetical protein